MTQQYGIVLKYSFACFFVFSAMSVDIPTFFRSLNNGSFSWVRSAHAAVAWQASSNIYASTGANVTVNLPGHRADDILLLQVVVRNVASTVTVAGWTSLGTIDRGTNARYYWFWKRATSNSETNPLVSKSSPTGDTYAAVTTYRGAVTVGDPWEVKGTKATGTASAAVLPGITTLSPDSLIVATLNEEDNAASKVTYTATSPTTLTERLYRDSTTGADGGVASGSGTKTTAGATGNVTATWNASPVGWGGFVLSLIPQRTTTLATGTDPAITTVAPGSGITDADVFTFKTDYGTDTVTSVTVNLSTANGVGTVSITDNADVVLGSASSPVSGSNVISVSGMTFGTTVTTYKVRITPLAHSAMPAVPGATYAITVPVTAWVSNNIQAGSDTDANFLNIDNASPLAATATSGIAGTGQVTVSWTTSQSLDFSRSVVLRWAAGTPGSEVPAEGVDYAWGNTVGAATVACVRTSDGVSVAVSGIDGGGTGGCSPTPLTGGQAYSYRVFQKDSNGNYNAGTTFTGSPFTPSGSGSLKYTSGTMTSSVFDSNIATGIGFNSIMWKGSLGAGMSPGKVRFQFAASNNAGGPWNYYGGATCGAGDWFDPILPGTPIELKGTVSAFCQTQWNNKRYFRYKVQLCSNDCVTQGDSTPIVNEIVINWAP